MKIETKVRANTDIEFNGRYQQVDVDVSLQNLANSYQPSEFRVVVTQNNRLDNAVTMTQPTFVEPNRLRYINNKALIFEAGNEYHHFDAFSCFYAGYGIDRVYHEMGDYHALLFPNEITKGQYIHEFDSDGRFVVNGGEIFGNELSLRNRMQYDAEAKVYWLTALVKQGGYDFQYWFVPKSQESRAKSQEVQQKTTTQRVDGSYWQTENEYAVYVYWRPFGARYDRLIGVSSVKSQ